MANLQEFDLGGKVALVTGCRRGIGKAMALGLAEAGADIVGVSASMEARGSDIETAVTALGRAFKGYQCDFADREAIYAFIARCKINHPRIDILINNAGTILRQPAVEHSDEYWDKVIDVNLSAQFVLTREFGKDMVERGAGKIIFYRVTAQFPGGRHGAGICSQQGWHRHADHGLRQ